MATLKVTVPPFIAKLLDDAGNIVPIWMAFFTRIAGLFPIDLTSSVIGILPVANGGLTPIIGTWTPVDASGAGLALVITTAEYAEVGPLVFVSTELAYPATADGSNAAIGGLPVTTSAAQGALTQGFGAVGTGVQWVVRANATTIAPFSLAGVVKTNAQLSTQTIILAGVYRRAA